MTTRQFKIAISSLKMFGQHDLENLTKYLDHICEGNGFININKILQQVNSAAAVNKGHTNVWNK